MGAEFLPVLNDNLKQIKKNRKRFLCAKKDEMKIQGTYNTDSGRLIEIELVKCADSSDCKSAEEIDEFFRKKHLVLLQNQMRLETKSFGENEVHQESILKWIPINTKEFVTIPY